MNFATLPPANPNSAGNSVSAISIAMSTETAAAMPM